MRCALYARYSSERQNERSIADQLTVCRRHAEARGWTVVASFDDAAISGAAMANRPGLHALLAAAEAGAFDLVLVEDEDRLARNLEHLAHIASRLAFAEVRLATLSTEQVEEMHVAFAGLQASQFLKNLSLKTRRGMAANAERGLATGSRLYGYATRPGGETVIVEDEARVIRRIYAGYAAGLTARDLVAALNADGVPGPRGGPWNVSTLVGSRQRGNGVLRTDLYGGVKTWNRMEVRKDPRTGRRVPRMRPKAEWKRTEVPHLRIVDAGAWAAVQARHDGNAGRRPDRVRRCGTGLFSGLLKCGWCGASYVGDGGPRLVCAARRERGKAACPRSRMVRRERLEAEVLDGLRTQLLTPDSVALYARAYHAAWTRLDAERRERRSPLERRRAELERGVVRLVDAIVGGTDTPALRERLAGMETERAAIAAQLAADAVEVAAAPTTLHPRAAEAFIAQVEQLREALDELGRDPANPDHRPLIDSVRALVDGIEVFASPERGGPIDLRLHGRLSEWASASEPFQLGGRVVAGGGDNPSPITIAVDIRLTS